MFFALNKIGERVCIDDANKQTKYFCPCCNYPVIVKQGEINAWHYAHKPGSECDAAYSEKTYWHRCWQDMFPEECREIVVQDMTGYKRIADVKIDGTTIEFQSKSIPKEIFDARNRHHIKASSNVIWVFKCYDKDIDVSGEAYETNGDFQGKYWYHWSHPNRMLAKYYFITWRKPKSLQDKDTNEIFKNVTIYLDTGDGELLEILYVNRDQENLGSFLAKPVDIDTFVTKFVGQYNQPKQTAMVL